MYVGAAASCGAEFATATDQFGPAQHVRQAAASGIAVVDAAAVVGDVDDQLLGDVDLDGEMFGARMP
jgi:hypothetical protein